ncbi:glycosyltransferase [Sutcliffiella horikoshii]|uniref:glycosyltransferase n=1 Tax=Sutcliffiella horikoshii TaxID=79883 RepID=UPI001CBE4719|nr:glycosyltransferase [Sutcliffiella horikoshii]UAL47159.1 glycosyltransferase [Sutcliffiella horikoshii]
MKIVKMLYFGKICDDELFIQKEQQQQPYFIAQYMFEKALTNEFLKDNRVDIDIVSIHQTDYFPKASFIFNRRNKKEMNLSYLKFINFPYMREMSFFVSACIKIMSWALKNRHIKNKFIYSSCHFPPVSLAIVIMGWVFSIKKVVTFTDLSLFTYSKHRIKNMRLYKKLLIKPYLLLVNKLQKSYNAYILFSQEMNKVVNQNNRPYLIMEGIYNSEKINLNAVSPKNNAIAHAGTLNEEVGISKILDVFELIEDKSIELWLIGKGDMTNEIKKRAELDKRIKYLGFMPRHLAFEKLKKAKLLVNLRNPDDIYTKHSFPSKMFEYMASGTPVLTTKLVGIPKEYYDYLYTVDTLNNEVIKDKIIKLVGNDEKELGRFGTRAQNFIISKKNSKEQTHKIIDFLSKSTF